MTAYFSVYFIIIYMWILHSIYGFSRDLEKFSRLVLFSILLLFMGLRHEVGGDWESYLFWYNSVAQGGLDLSLKGIVISDFGYNLLNWISSKLNLGIYGVNTMSAFLFLLGVFSFLKTTERFHSDFYLGLLVLYPYLIMVAGMGYTRQSVAIGLGLLALSQSLKGKDKMALLSSILSVLFHKTGVVNILIVSLVSKRVRKYALILIIIGGLFLLPFINIVALRFITHYLQNPKVSFGGIYRASIISLAIFGIIILSKLGLEELRKPWVSLAWFSLPLALMAFFNLTVGDRMLLYFYGLMVVFFTRVKDIFKGVLKPPYYYTVLMFFLAFMTVWMVFGVHSEEWLPYDNLILTLLK